MHSDTSQAIVIGGSMAGLLTARVLRDHFDHVTIIERDKLPTDATYRSGVPQTRHLHTLLAYGEALLEDLFPGLGLELEDYGVPRIEWGMDTRFNTKSGWLPSFQAGLISHTASQPESISLLLV